jgi:hypothetical protein
VTNLDEMAAAGLGGTIGARVAGHLQRAVAQTRIQLGPHQNAIAQKILADFTNHVSDEIRGVMGPLWNQIADSTDTAPWLRDLARKLGNERGQAWTWIAGTSTSLAMGGGLGLVLQNELQPILGALIRANPHIPLAPADAAAAVTRGLWSDVPASGDAGQFGINERRWTILKGLNQVVLTEGMILELFAKGWIDAAAARAYFTRAGWDGHHANQLLPLGRTWISPRDAGSMWNRSILTEEQVREIIVRNGHHPSDAKHYMEVTGEPLPIQDIMTAQRRGIIDVARARRGWVQGPVRNEWFDVAQELQYSPMSTVDAADSVNQGHMDIGEGRQIAEWNGLLADHFQTLIENAGLPPGVELATEAWNRGLLTDAQFRQAFLESRLKNKYVPLYQALRWRVIPQETVRRLFRLGVYTREQTSERLKWAGFSPEDREALLAAEELSTDDSTRELTKTEVISLYSDRAIGRDAAAEMLGALGYPTGEVDWLLTIAELRRQRKYADAVVARVRAGYVAHRLDSTDAATIMDELRIPVDQREELISLWDLERLALTKGLTPAQLKTAMKKAIITEDEAIQGLIDQGYSDRDAQILLMI